MMLPQVLIDSSVWIDHLKQLDSPEVRALKQLLSPEAKAQIVIGDLILLEVLQGFRHDRDFHLTRSLMTQLPQVSLSNPQLAIQTAENFRYLRKKGITVRKTIDCMIATWCIAHQTPLLFSDRDFQPFCQYLGLINYANTVSNPA